MTFIPILEVEIPEHCGTVVFSNYDPDVAAERAIVCLVVLRNDGTSFVDNLARTTDERLAQTLEIFLKEGVSLVCVEGMEQERGRPEAMGSKVHEALRKGAARVVGVDDLGLESAMMSVWNEAQMSEARYGGLFADVYDYIERASRLAAPAVATFVKLRHDYESEKLPLQTLSKSLFELEEATGCYLPSEIKKPLIAMFREGEIDFKASEAEQHELIARLKQNATEGVIDTDRVTTFRKKLEMAVAPTQTELIAREYSRPTPPHEYSPLPLAPHEVAALAHFRLRLGIDGGLSVAFAGNAYESQVYQSARPKKEDIREVYDMAQMLGIDLDAYPNFCKYLEYRHALDDQHLAELLQVVVQVAPKAFAYFEARAFSGRDEKQILSCLTRRELLKKVAGLTLMPEEYDVLVEVLDDAFLTGILESLSLGNMAVSAEVLDAARHFDERRDFFISFYGNARKRASGMALGTLQQMDQSGVGKALLICLGFHLPTIKATLTSEQIPFWIFYPVVKSSGSAETSL